MGDSRPFGKFRGIYEKVVSTCIIQIFMVYTTYNDVAFWQQKLLRLALESPVISKL